MKDGQELPAKDATGDAANLSPVVNGLVNGLILSRRRLSRAPRPTLHLLRMEDLEAASFAAKAKTGPDIQQVLEANAERAAAIGLETWKIGRHGRSAPRLRLSGARAELATARDWKRSVAAGLRQKSSAMAEPAALSPATGEDATEPVFWGKKWHEGGFEKNVIHFDKTAKVMRDIFDATHGFQKELGSRYTFLDIACAPGGFSRFLCSDPRCIWALLFQQLRLGLSNLRNGGVMMFRLNCKDGNVDWYFDCVCQVLAMIDRLFESMLLFKSGKSHQSDAWTPCEFEAMQGAEILRKSIMVSRYELEDPGSFNYASTVKEWRCARSVPALRREVRSNMGTLMPLVASRVAAKQLEKTIQEMDVLSESFSEVQSLDALRKVLQAKCQETKEKLQERAAELQNIITAAQEASTAATEIEGEEFNPGVFEEGWARTAEPEPDSSQYLHESTLQRCFSRAGKVEEIRFLPQEIFAVKMSSVEEAKVAREKLEPWGCLQGFEMERTLMITFQVKNGIQVCDHLFVRGIPSAVQKHQIASLFNCYGQVLWSSILPQRLGEEDRCALVQMASSDEAQNAIQALNWSSSSALMPSMMVRYAGSKVFVALQATEGIHDGIDEGEGSEEDEDFAHFGVIDEAPKPAFQPLKERPQEMGSRWKKAEEEDWDGPEGTRLWGWAMQPVKEAVNEFPELGRDAQVEEVQPPEPENWEELGDDEPSEFLCMKDPPKGLPDSVMQMWFKPYGHVVEMWPLEQSLYQEENDSVAFLVHMSCKEEAINAFSALNGKSIMRGCPLNLSYWHGPVERASPPKSAVDSNRLLAAARLLASKKKEAFEAETWRFIRQSDVSAPDSKETATVEPPQPTVSRYLCLEDPPNLPETVIEVWFKPYGSLVEMKRETSDPVAYVVHMSSEEEATRAHDALNGKVIMGKSLSVRYWHQKSTNGATAEAPQRCPGPGVGIDDQQLVDACKVALAQRKHNLEVPAPKGGDVESWEDLEDVDEALGTSTSASGHDVPSDALCISGVPPGIQEMVMQFWFRPHGTVLELRPFSASELGRGPCRPPAYLVKLSSVDEAKAARSALDGKPVMKGSPLVVVPTTEVTQNTGALENLERGFGRGGEVAPLDELQPDFPEGLESESGADSEDSFLVPDAPASVDETSAGDDDCFVMEPLEANAPEASPDCSGDNQRMVGRVADKRTGVCIDIFAYGVVEELRPWQKDPRYKEVTWWERRNDHADFTFPREALLPLQNDTFAGKPMMVPANPRDFLSWEYGQCLGAHVWPWRILLYTPHATEPLLLILALRGAVLLLGSSGINIFPPFILILCMAGTVAILKGGLVPCCVLVLSFWEMLILTVRSDWCILRRLHAVLAVLAISICLQLLQGSLEQLMCQLDDFYLHPRRPKSWTLCLLGSCWDF
eukprot:s757_g12.t2